MDAVARLTGALFKRIGYRRLRKWSADNNCQRDRDVLAWASTNVPRARPGISQTQRLKISKAICKAYPHTDEASKVDAARKIAKTLNDPNPQRALSVLNTEFTRICGYASLYEIRSAGFEKKMWVWCPGGPCGDAHATLADQIVATDSPFVSANGHVAMYPGDFGIAAEDDNCGCGLTPVFPGQTEPC